MTLSQIIKIIDVNTHTIIHNRSLTMNDDSSAIRVKEHDDMLHDFVLKNIAIIPNFIEDVEVTRRWTNNHTSVWKSLTRELENIGAYDLVNRQLDKIDGDFDLIDNNMLLEYLEAFPTLVWIRLISYDNESTLLFLIKIDKLDYLMNGLERIQEKYHDSLRTRIVCKTDFFSVLSHLQSIEQAQFLYENLTHSLCIPKIDVVISEFYYYYAVIADDSHYDDFCRIVVNWTDQTIRPPESSLVYYFASYKYLLYTEQTTILRGFFNGVLKMDYVKLLALLINKTTIIELFNYGYIQSLEIVKLLDELKLVDWNRFFNRDSMSESLLKNVEFVQWVINHNKITDVDNYVNLFFNILDVEVPNLLAIKLLVTHPAYNVYFEVLIYERDLYTILVNHSENRLEDTIELIEFFVKR